MSTAQYVANMPDVSVGVNPNMTDDSFGSGKSLWAKFGSFFSGIDSESQYQNALTENNRRYEQAMLNDARNYETWFDSTAVQRRVNDIKAAGLNPWLALQSGGISSNGSSGNPSPGSGSSAKSTSNNGKGATSSLAMLLMATAKLLAVL